ncbi:MAG: peptide chain release factor N(5)-glutamine methyltransferase [Rhizobiales bacterium]|nr:peptide chain release factor N(5)-glutamine methyltransferase [Hyphomicrobiales bacterium]
MALARGRALLVAADSPDAALDVRLLLQAVMDLDHAGVISADRQVLTPEQARRFDQFLARRLAREPVSKILGQRDFYGRLFKVTADVLDPRADTETLIDLALELRAGPGGRVLDLGSGSGAIICTLLAEWPDVTGVAVDLSAAALAVTAENAERLGVNTRITLVQGDWFSGVAGRFDLIVSNPPYIPAGEIAALEPDVRAHDPHLALAGGPDGLSCYRAIASGAAAHLAAGGRIIVEIGAGQRADVAALFSAAGLVLTAERLDLGGHVRALQFAALS